ncbi:stage III sporulation protein AE [Caproiciproducens galactitolivorans]|uniref:Stage III sporulation protein AE n=1 Tax=Caproiciproducens galactitolivorans TaxID=642589 RepID=A0A4Z0YBA2_9FIRM|nr:stage III sporulation protein AE [Caproiciproducens galactitolivorans]QEY33953.1 stage III sporulation protein AE [Caproiciproducens galactitolivorans]TGJ76083.1 stage III sporulation protein AE precursor [Caproiciproducens galactitolivorans]
MKRIACFLLTLFFLSAFLPQAYAAENQEKYYQQQLEQSGAEDLPYKLPEETRKALENLGIENADWKSISSITPQNFFEHILSVAAGKTGAPFKAAVSVVAVMLLCALLDGMKLSFGEKALGGVIGMVATLCISIIVINPIVSCIVNAATVIRAAAGFLLACVPVLAGIMVAAGQSVSASSYNLLMVAAGNVISLLSANILVPLMNIFLALSIVSAVSPNMNLNGLCEAFSKSAKWIMGFCMTVFTGLLTIHSIVATAMDTAGTRAAKFVVSSFVPVVGNALGEALYTINGCVKMLKSGVSAFGLLAGLCIFLPILIECLIWLITIHICAGIGTIFSLKEITMLLKAVVNVIETLLGIILCCMAILTVSTAAMLIIGGVS